MGIGCVAELVSGEVEVSVSVAAGLLQFLNIAIAAVVHLDGLLEVENGRHICDRGLWILVKLIVSNRGAWC